MMSAAENEYDNQFSKGALQVFLERPNWFPGETLSGIVQLFLHAPLVPGFSITTKLYIKETIVETPQGLA